jgi:hypothetical protein
LQSTPFALRFEAISVNGGRDVHIPIP